MMKLLTVKIKNPLHNQNQNNNIIKDWFKKYTDNITFKKKKLATMEITKNLLKKGKVKINFFLTFRDC